MSREPYPAWARSVEQVCDYHKVQPQVGLSSDKIEAKREEYGYNELTKPPGKPMWRLVLEQFDDMMVKVCSSALSPGMWLVLGDPEALQDTRAHLRILFYDLSRHQSYQHFIKELGYRRYCSWPQ